MNKKGVELTLNTVIIIVLVLIVLIVLAFMFSGAASNFFKNTGCHLPAQCKAQCLPTEQANGWQCGSGQVCCESINSIIK